MEGLNLRLTLCAVSNEELAEQPSQKLAPASAGQQENSDVKRDGKDAFVVGTPGISAAGNDLTAAERSTVVLGEGSPKVLFLFFLVVGLISSTLHVMLPLHL